MNLAIETLEQMLAEAKRLQRQAEAQYNRAQGQIDLLEALVLTDSEEDEAEEDGGE